jgi:hypothetical protein
MSNLVSPKKKNGILTIVKMTFQKLHMKHQIAQKSSNN